MSWYGRGDGRTRIGLIDLEVDPRHRRKGYGRHLIAEILRQARNDMVALVEIQTSATNVPALALYESLQFDPVETAILYAAVPWRTASATLPMKPVEDLSGRACPVRSGRSASWRPH